MQTLDWMMVLIPLTIVICVGAFTQHYMRSVADFVSGGRVAGRYLLAVSRGEMSAGAVVFAAAFEIFHKAGFTLNWWGSLTAPLGLILAVTGFVFYRFRETRAMTLAQFFEIRYSKSFRVFTGSLGFFAGLINFGIIPAIGARFISYYLGFPPTVVVFSMTLPTPVLVMVVLLTITMLITVSGGLITVMVTDCLEGIISQLFYLLIICSLLAAFSWTEIHQVMANRPPGHSMFNPFDSNSLKDFNLWYVLMGAIISVYGTMAWQNRSAFNSAGLTPHESRMANTLGHWREFGKQAVIVLMAVCSMTYLQHPDFAAQSLEVQKAVGEISDPQVQSQMRIPIAVSHLLPTGAKGAFLVILLMGIFGGDSTHLHSWSGMFVQDVLVPLRKKPFSTKQHIRLLRLSVVGVAGFVFCFGALFQQTQYIAMWFAVTSAIYVGGAGAAIIGGLYWRKGTTAGAWSALVVGSSLSVGGIVAQGVFKTDFPLNGIQVSFLATLTAIIVYVGVSLVTFKEDFNMDRMLHRGEYRAVKDLMGDQQIAVATNRRSLSLLERMIGYDENFTRGDRWIAGALVAWSFMWFGIFIVGSLWNLIAPWPEHIWSTYWHVMGVGLPVFLSFVSGIWFTWGGIRDIRALFRHLRQEKVNKFDDGTVLAGRNLDEASATNDRTIAP